MTALTEFQRLESGGAWRAAPDARLRDVVVSVGDATLILSDPKSEQPLAHWSLPAVSRLNPGQMPAVFAPGPDDHDEQLELDDSLMIDAIGRVQRAIAARQAHPGRLRGGLVALGVAAMLLVAALWLPGATIRYAARIAPPAQQKLVGAAVMAQLGRATGAACAGRSGQAVLDHLTARLLGPGLQPRILPATLAARQLPGGYIVLGRDLVEDQPDATRLAAHLLAARSAQTDARAMLDALRHIGFAATLRLLTAGTVREPALAGYGEALLSRPPPLPDSAALNAAIAAQPVNRAALSASLDPDHDRALLDALADSATDDDAGADTEPPPPGDPEQAPAAPLLTDQQWLALQQICGR